VPSVKVFVLCVAPLVPWVFLELWLALNVDYSSLLNTDRPIVGSVRVAIAIENSLIRYLHGGLFLATFNPVVELGIVWWNGAFGDARSESFDSRRETRHLVAWLMVSVLSVALGVLALVTDSGPWPSIHSLGLWAGTVAYSLCLVSVYSLEKRRSRLGETTWSPAWILAAGLLLPIYWWPFLLVVVPVLTLIRGVRRSAATIGT
jgi:hypothetical protein